MKQLFQPGTSGNPAGRPKSPPEPMQAVRQQIAALLPEIVERSLAQVRSGNVAALGDLVRLATAITEASKANRRAAPAK